MNYIIWGHACNHSRSLLQLNSIDLKRLSLKIMIFATCEVQIAANQGHVMFSWQVQLA